MNYLLKGIKNIFIFLLKQISTFIIQISLFIILIISIIYMGFIYRNMKKIESLNTNYKYIEIDMSLNYKEAASSYLDMLKGGNIEYYDFLVNLKQIKEDKQIKGIILKLDNFSLNSAQSEEIGKILNEFSSDKEIYAYSTGFTKRAYLFATNATTIIMPDTASSSSDISGYSLEIPFYKRVADYFGVEFTVVHMGDYKSFGENLISNTMSEFSKENTLELMNNVQNNFFTKVSKNRKLDRIKLEENIMQGELVSSTPMKLMEEKLIDKNMFYYNFIKSLEKDSVITYEEYDEIIINKNITKKKLLEKNKLNSSIGIIFLNGEIVQGIENAGDLNNSIEPENTIRLLNKAFDNEKIKGIVLRINSPGGSALSSEIIHNAIKSGKGKKPVYISIGSVAASGGYYIASAGDKIFANENSITGSIGVVSIIPNIGKLAKTIGIDIEILKEGKNTNLYSIIQPMTKERFSILLKSNARVYDEFKSRVSIGRNMKLEEVEKVAKGKVWTGLQGKENGLVDEIATLDQVIIKLSEDLNIKKDEYNVQKIEDLNTKNNLINYFVSYLSILENTKLLSNILNFTSIDTKNIENSFYKIEKNIEQEKKFYSPLLYSPISDKIVNNII
ncbi:MAG: signal peptide peptidase SppA [Fusobacteriaceae bacterium]